MGVRPRRRDDICALAKQLPPRFHGVNVPKCVFGGGIACTLVGLGLAWHGRVQFENPVVAHVCRFGLSKEKFKSADVYSTAWHLSSGYKHFIDSSIQISPNINEEMQYWGMAWRGLSDDEKIVHRQNETRITQAQALASLDMELSTIACFQYNSFRDNPPAQGTTIGVEVSDPEVLFDLANKALKRCDDHLSPAEERRTWRTNVTSFEMLPNADLFLSIGQGPAFFVVERGTMLPYYWDNDAFEWVPYATPVLSKWQLYCSRF